MTRAEAFRPAKSDATDINASPLVGHMTELLKRGTPPPPSCIDGQGVDNDADGTFDAISFQQTGGQSSQLWPFVDDPALDSFLGEQLPTTLPGLTARYLEVLDALDHGPAIMLPGTSCRLGGFELGIDARLLPFTDFFAHWQSIGDYRACVEEAMNQLSRQRLYDRRLGGIPSR